MVPGWLFYWARQGLNTAPGVPSLQRGLPTYPSRASQVVTRLHNSPGLPSQLVQTQGLVAQDVFMPCNPQNLQGFAIPAKTAPEGSFRQLFSDCFCFLVSTMILACTTHTHSAFVLCRQIRARASLCAPSLATAVCLPTTCGAPHGSPQKHDKRPWQQRCSNSNCSNGNFPTELCSNRSNCLWLPAVPGLLCERR